MGVLLEDGTFADTAFDVGGTRFVGHRAILAAHSEYFCRMFTSAWREAEGGALITVGETTPAALRCMLRYLYTDHLTLDDELVIDVLRKAKEWQLERAYHLAMLHCARRTGIGNAVRWLVRAHASHLDELRTLALAYIRSNFRRIRDEMPSTLDELKENPDLQHEIMMTAL